MCKKKQIQSKNTITIKDVELLTYKLWPLIRSVNKETYLGKFARKELQNLRAMLQLQLFRRHRHQNSNIETEFAPGGTRVYF